jgi:hypothetical protein
MLRRFCTGVFVFNLPLHIVCRRCINHPGVAGGQPSRNNHVCGGASRREDLGAVRKYDVFNEYIAVRGYKQQDVQGSFWGTFWFSVFGLQALGSILRSLALPHITDRV